MEDSPAGSTPVTSVAQAANDGTFTVTLPNGAIVIARKPQGVLALRLKRLLGNDFKDPQIQAIGRAVLGIVSYNGAPPVLRTPMEFEGFLQRFGTDEDMDFFITAYQRFVNPEAMEVAERVIAEGIEQGLSGDALEAYVVKQSLEVSRKHLEAVRD